MFFFGTRATFIGRLIHDLIFPLADIFVKNILVDRVTNVLIFSLSELAKYVNLFYDIIYLSSSTEHYTSLYNGLRYSPDAQHLYEQST